MNRKVLNEGLQDAALLRHVVFEQHVVEVVEAKGHVTTWDELYGVLLGSEAWLTHAISAAAKAIVAKE